MRAWIPGRGAGKRVANPEGAASTMVHLLSPMACAMPTSDGFGEEHII